jgi:hypothetical protein
VTTSPTRMVDLQLAALRIMVPRIILSSCFPDPKVGQHLFSDAAVLKAVTGFTDDDGEQAFMVSYATAIIAETNDLTAEILLLLDHVEAASKSPRLTVVRTNGEEGD